MKKVIYLISILVVLSMFVGACAPAAPTTAPEATKAPAAAEPTKAPAAEPTKAPAAVGSNAFAYDQSKEVNGGKPITIKFWTWNGFDYLYKAWAEDYQKVHPNVTIEFTVSPKSDRSHVVL